jgi:hypothetical protein
MSEDILHSSVFFHGVERKYLHGRGSGCPMHRLYKPSRVLKVNGSKIFKACLVKGMVQGWPQE